VIQCVENSRISKPSAHEGCQPYAPAVFTPRKYFWYSFLLDVESTRKGYVNEKFQLTQSGIEPATFRLLAQCLSQLRHHQRASLFLFVKFDKALAF
jgi:hypothetical protein